MDPFVYIFSTLIFVLMSILLKNSCFEGPNADAQRQVKAASKFRKWGGWSSGMHNLIDLDMKGRMKDVSVLLIIPFQILFKDKTSIYPVVMVSNFAHAISGMLLFLLSKQFWGIEASIILYLIYIFSIWPYMIILNGGFQVVGQMFFLLALYFLFIDIENNFYLELFFYFLSGAFFASMNFSSSSSRKYIWPYFFGLVFALSNGSLYPWLLMDNNLVFSAGHWVMIFSLIILFASILLLFFFNNRLIALIYNNNFKFFSFRRKDTIKLEYYLNHSRFIIKEIWRYSFFASSYLVIILFFVHDNASYIKLLFLICGFLIFVIYFLSPNIIQNVNAYFRYFTDESQRFRENAKSHFSLYKEYFLKNYGKIFESGEEGYLMYFKMYFRLIPFQTILFVFSLVFLFYQSFVYRNLDIPSFFIILLVSLSPILWNEYTMGPKALLPFYTSYVPLFFPIGLCINIIINQKVLFMTNVNYILIFFLLFLFWNLYYFFTDIFPSKMCVNKIVNTLKKNNISEFYTYNGLINHSFADLIELEYNDIFNIRYIKSISELRKGIVLVPCLSSKTVYHESSAMGYRHGDFREDSALNDLVSSKKIEDIAIGKFKTQGTSPFWQLLYNVPAFRDLVLKEINKDTRYLGHAWLIDVSKLKKYNTIK